MLSKLQCITCRALQGVEDYVDWFTAAPIMDAVWQVAHRWTKLWGGLHGFPLALEDWRLLHTHSDGQVGDLFSVRRSVVASSLADGWMDCSQEEYSIRPCSRMGH